MASPSIYLLFVERLSTVVPPGRPGVGDRWGQGKAWMSQTHHDTPSPLMSSWPELLPAPPKNTRFHVALRASKSE